MRSRTTPSAPAPEPQTKAMQALEHNLDTIAHMQHLTKRQLAATRDQLAKASRLVTLATKGRDLASKQGQKELTQVLKRLTKRMEIITEGIQRHQVVTLWQVVMLVTCVEAYLQDALIEAASIDPQLMSSSEQRALYADVVAAASLEELASEMRGRWARGWLREGGPTRWMTRLGKMGAKGYPDDLGPRLERYWGIRHVVVHTAGAATADFVKRHPDVPRTTGNRVRVSTQDFQKFVQAVRDFLEPTERFLLGRFPSMLAAPSGAAPATPAIH